MPQDYTVKAGDNLTSIIARLCNLTAEKVARRRLVALNARLNNLADVATLRVGQSLKIYCSEPAEGPGKPEQPGHPGSGPSEGAVVACFKRCYERYLERIRACRREQDADVKRACLAGARDVLQACLKHCADHAGSAEGGGQPDKTSGSGTPAHGSAPRGCRNQSARMVGIDVSHHQGDIDFRLVARDVRCFVYIKATEGATYRDPKTATYARDAKQAGLSIGYYHFARPKSGDAEVEARAFLARVARLPAADLVPALDLEAFEKHTLTDAELTTWADTWLTFVSRRIGGKKPLLYVNRTWGNKMTPAATPVQQYPLWFANYVRGANPAPPTAQPRLPTLWSTYSLWQFTQKGRVRGIRGNVDLNLAPRGIAHLKLR